jgi:hypothetical protein
MKHVYTRKTGALTLADGTVYQCSCKVRNLENRLRRRDEVVRTVPEREPYSPQPFPPGRWTITGIEYRIHHFISLDFLYNSHTDSFLNYSRTSEKKQ